MQRCIIAISSMTYAIKGEKALKKYDISVSITRLTADQTERGCAYGLCIPCHFTNQAYGILANAGVPAGQLVQEW